MLNLSNMVKAPMYRWRVEMARCTTSNARENQRQQIEYVQASNEDDAKREAKRIRPQFHPVSVRRES